MTGTPCSMGLKTHTKGDVVVVQCIACPTTQVITQQPIEVLGFEQQHFHFALPQPVTHLGPSIAAGKIKAAPLVHIAPWGP